MKILLVDDSSKHRKAGVAALTALGHEVVALSGYAEVIERLYQGETFDAALLDLLMPAEAMTLGTTGLAHLGESIAVGYPLAIKLALKGVKYVAVATDTNHHDHPASAIMDWFRGARIRVNDSLVCYRHADLNEDGTKKWIEILSELMKT